MSHFWAVFMLRFDHFWAILSHLGAMFGAFLVIGPFLGTLWHFIAILVTLAPSHIDNQSTGIRIS